MVELKKSAGVNNAGSRYQVLLGTLTIDVSTVRADISPTINISLSVT